jgi:hypothetical protein
MAVPLDGRAGGSAAQAALAAQPLRTQGDLAQPPKIFRTTVFARRVTRR